YHYCYYVCVCLLLYLSYCSFCDDDAQPEIYTLSLHDALPISEVFALPVGFCSGSLGAGTAGSATGCNDLLGPGPELSAVLRDWRSEEHTSELQSRFDLVCRLLLEKKNVNG